jgi:hypothetical protein
MRKTFDELPLGLPLSLSRLQGKQDRRHFTASEAI